MEALTIDLESSETPSFLGFFSQQKPTQISFGINLGIERRYRYWDSNSEQVECHLLVSLQHSRLRFLFTVK
ncbi:hypothetical protein GQ457_06G033490 [Hibiscus cannabinus]